MEFMAGGPYDVLLLAGTDSLRVLHEKCSTNARRKFLIIDVSDQTNFSKQSKFIDCVSNEGGELGLSD